MEIVEKKIKLGNIDLLAFLGFNDANLTVLESRFDTTVTVRGDTVILRGEPTETAIIEKIIIATSVLSIGNGPKIGSCGNESM